MFRILTVIFLATLSINLAYRTFSEANNPEQKTALVAGEPKVKISKNTVEQQHKKHSKTKKAKIEKITESIDKIKDEWVVPFKPNLISNNKADSKKIDNIDDTIKAMASRAGVTNSKDISLEPKKITAIDETDLVSASEIGLEEPKDNNESQFSYLAEPQLKPLAALSEPTSFINPVGGKIVFKPQLTASYNINSDNLLNDRPASSSFVLTSDRRGKINKVANQTKSYKKRTFISSIGLATAEINQKVFNERTALLYVLKRYDSGATLTANERIWITRLAKKYEVSGFSFPNKAHREELLNRVNVIPESLAVAQAALESGWGSSAMAKQGFNYFGHKCFGPSCRATLINPANKNPYAIFHSPKEAVEEYVHNLNTHGSYKKFRIAREYLGSNASGKQLVPYLDSYSSQGNSYEQKVKQIIEGNNLE